MRFDIVTLFPKFFDSPLQESLVAKGINSKKIEVNIVNLREYSDLPHSQVDDKPYGGGAGMVLRADILANCVKALRRPKSKVILMDPTGQRLDQNFAYELAKESHLIIVCGRYEGVDQRFKEKYVDLAISIGDYVLNGGEVASLVILESVARLTPNLVGNKVSLENESFAPNLEGLLDFPSYTRPEDFEGEKVPDILLSGNHQKIENWRKEKSLEITKRLRPDLLEKK
jgi:tRNA (guanine37-N1)-methyltransferase